MASARVMPRDPVAVAHVVLAAAPADTPPSDEELTALALAYLDTIGELTAQAVTR